ncbi:MAG: sugar ABC transporter substrate-binding protein [Chloroflexi bacterium]|nr:sugar ABC transporter substrate-binding protein [Chloroflexota bacterium]MCL5075987.1 sugar ABC transporter substrate-binding protein [Chloroflexota bacterium]
MLKPARFLCSLGLILSLLLTSCSLVAPTTATPTPQKPPTVVRFASWQWGEPGFGDFYRAAAKAFEVANPAIHIEEYSLPVSQYFDKMLIEVQSGSPADLIMLRGANYLQYVSMGVLKPLDDYLAKTDILSRWDPAQTSVLKVDGKIYGLLMMTRNYQIVYNKKAFAAAGIDKFPQTPEEFYAAAVKLTKKGITGEQNYGYAFATTQKDYGFYEDIVLWVNCFGGNFARDGKVTATDPNTIKGLAFMKSLFDAGVTPKGVGFDQTQQWLAEGKLGMLHGGPFVYKFIEQRFPDKIQDIGFAGLPSPNHTSTGGPQNVLVIPAAAKNSDAAWEFMKFLAQPDWQRKFPEMTFSLPGMGDALSPDFQAKYPWFKIFADAQPYTITIAPPGFEIYFSEWQKLVGDKVEGMFYNNRPPAQVAQDIQKTLEEFVASKKK